MEALSGGLGGLVIDNDLEKSEEDRINIFYKFVVNKKNAGPINQGVGAKEVIAEADRLEVRNKAPIVLCELLFNDKMFKEKQIEKDSNVMRLDPVLSSFLSELRGAGGVASIQHQSWSFL